MFIINNLNRFGSAGFIIDSYFKLKGGGLYQVLCAILMAYLVFTSFVLFNLSICHKCHKEFIYAPIPNLVGLSNISSN